MGKRMGRSSCGEMLGYSWDIAGMLLVYRSDVRRWTSKRLGFRAC